MTLYEIDEQIEKAFLASFDPETGEIIDEAAKKLLDELMMGREEKLENIALYIKNLTAEAEALKAEKMAFAARQKAAENKVESLKKYLSYALDYNHFKTTRVDVRFRGNDYTEMDEDFDILDIPTEYLKAEYTIKKADAMKAMKAGVEIPGLHIEHRKSISVK